MKRIFSISLLAILAITLQAANVWDGFDYATVHDIAYTTKTDAYAQSRLKLDIHYPTNASGCKVVVWYHGGGLTGGSKELPAQLCNKDLVVVGVNYRLLPKVTIDTCLDDCAEALAWVVRNIGRFGGDKHKIFVSGHSAGGYITLMLGLDKHWLARYGVDADSLAGLLPLSAQCISHFSYRKMHGIGNLQPTIDAYAPLYHVRKLAEPVVLTTGDRDVEIFGRYEENAYLWRMLRLTGNERVKLLEIGGHGHVPMMQPGLHIVETWIRAIAGEPAGETCTW